MSVVTPNRRGARSREVVLDTASRLMAEHGYEAATMAAIVDESAIPASSVYHYFGSKDGVLLAVLERGAGRFFAELDLPTERIGDPLAHLTHAGESLQAALPRHPEFLRLLLVLAVQPGAMDAAAIQSVVRGVRDTGLEALRRQIALAFGLEPAAARVAELARVALALVDGAFVAHTADAVDLDRMLASFAPALVALNDTLP